MNDPIQEREDREKTHRVTLFTVKNANRTMVFLAVLILLIIVSIFGYGLIYKKQTFSKVLVDIINNNPVGAISGSHWVYLNPLHCLFPRKIRCDSEIAPTGLDTWV